MTETELLQAVHEALAKHDAPDGFYTREEWQDILGMGQWATMRRLKALEKAGRLQIGSKMVQRFGVPGTQTPAPAYKFIENPPEIA